MHSEMKAIYDRVVARDPHQVEFHQACLEVLETLGPVIDENPAFAPIVDAGEPERIIQFRVPWVDDRVNRKSTADTASSTTGRLGPTRWASLPSQRQSERPQVPGLRADLQEQPHGSTHGWGKGR